jgi:hypothetical protein
MLILGIIIGSFLTYNVPLTTIHNDCLRGDQNACIAEDKMSVYKHKE